MKRVRYRFHPGEYELGENEKFYGDMEAKGWRLVKRGSNLSRFEPVEPQKTRYRVEVSSPAFLEEEGLSEGQLAVFEDCGWEYVTSRGFLHIFRAPEGSGAPEFYAEPIQQAQTLKKIRRDMWIGVAVSVAALAFAACFPFFTGRTPGQFFGEMFKRFVQIPTLYAMYGSWLLWAVCQLAWGAWKLNRTYFRLKKGKPLDHAPKGRRGLHRLAHPGLLCLTGLFLLLTIGQLIATRSGDLPETPNGPYIMLRDIGWEGERGNFMGITSGVTRTSSPLADYWDITEVINPPSGDQVWMRQYVYRLRFPGMADTLARAMMEKPILAHGPEAFRPTEAEGLDGSWAAHYELVAVKGGFVAYVEFLGWGQDGMDAQAICAALRSAWEG